MFQKMMVLVVFCICFVGCSQKKESMISQNPNINEKNLVEEINKQVKHYPSEKVYGFRYENFNCYFEVFVNDIPCYKDFITHKAGSGFDVNVCIFKSGIQKLKFKMYPANDEKTTINEFIESTYLKLQLETYDKKHRDADDVVIQKFKTPVTITKDQYGNNNEKFIAAGKSYYEGSFTFEAQVPYQLEGFDTIQDLRKIDPKIMKQKLVEKYQEIWKVYQNKQYDDIARISFENLRDQFIAEYHNEKHIGDVWGMLMDIYKQPTFEMQPLQDYELVFFADGKLVALMQTSNDNRLRGHSALWAKVDYDGGIRPQFCNRYFYIREGETAFKVY